MPRLGGRDPLAGVEWEIDEDLRNGDPKIVLRFDEKAVQRLYLGAKGERVSPVLLEVEVPVSVETEYGAQGSSQTVVLEIGGRQ